MKQVFHAALALAATAAACTAHAHIHLEYGVGNAGSSYKATFQLGHGCSGSATRQISVDIPPGVTGVRPMPKPGWTLELQRAASQGQAPGAVTRVTWAARTPADVLPDSHYDEFVLVGRLPAAAGRIHWPVRQVCEQGRADWTEVPQAGQQAGELKLPAPALDVLPAAGGHKH